MALRTPYPRCIGPAAMPTGAAASVFQAPERLAIHRFTFSNTTAGTLTVTLHKVASGGSATTGNQIIPTLSIQSNDVLVVLCPVILERGESIYALASGAVNLTFIVNDRETEVL